MKEQVSIAIVGCGGIAGGHLAGYERLARAGYDRFRIDAVVDPNPAGTANFIEQISKWQATKPQAFATVEELLRATRINGADICTPHAMHHTAALACLKKGVNVMVEKPCGITIRASHKMLDAAAKSGAFIATAEQVRRCLPARTMEWAINKKKIIGAPRMMSMDVMFHQQFDWKKYAFAWRGLKLLGGGGMCLDAGAHFTDMMLHVFGPVDEVVCDMRTFWTPTLNGPLGLGKQPLDVEDTWMAILRFKSGFLAQWSWSREVRGFKVRTGVYYGSKGSLRDKQEWMHPFQFGADLITNDGVEVPYEDFEKQYQASLSQKAKDKLFPYDMTDGMTNECWDFVDAIDRGRQPEVTGEDGMMAKAVCYAMYESNLSRGPVKVDDVASGKVRAYQKPIDAYWKI